MSKLKGNLKNLEDFLLLFNLIESGKLVLKLPYSNRKLILCIKDTKVYILNDLEGKTPERFLQMFIEEWVYSSLPLFFENRLQETCSGDKYLTREEIKKIITNPLMEEIRNIPKQFEIVEINSENIPTFLKFYYSLRKPLSVQSLHSNNFTLIDLIKLLRSRSIKIKPVEKIDSFPSLLSLLLSIVIVLAIILYMLPINYTKVNVLNLNKVENVILRDKILSQRMHPINGCLKTKYIIEGKKISVLLEYKKVIVKKLLEKELPNKGYIPIFAIPEK